MDPFGNVQLVGQRLQFGEVRWFVPADGEKVRRRVLVQDQPSGAKKGRMVLDRTDRGHHGHDLFAVTKSQRRARRRLGQAFFPPFRRGRVGDHADAPPWNPFHPGGELAGRLAVGRVLGPESGQHARRPTAPPSMPVAEVSTAAEDFAPSGHQDRQNSIKLAGGREGVDDVGLDLSDESCQAAQAANGAPPANAATLRKHDRPYGKRRRIKPLNTAKHAKIKVKLVARQFPLQKQQMLLRAAFRTPEIVNQKKKPALFAQGAPSNRCRQALSRLPLESVRIKVVRDSRAVP